MHTEAHTETHTETHTEAHTEAHTEVHTEAHTEAHTHTDPLVLLIELNFSFLAEVVTPLTPFLRIDRMTAPVHSVSCVVHTHTRTTNTTNTANRTHNILATW